MYQSIPSLTILPPPPPLENPPGKFLWTNSPPPEQKRVQNPHPLGLFLRSEFSSLILLMSSFIPTFSFLIVFTVSCTNATDLAHSEQSWTGTSQRKHPLRLRNSDPNFYLQRCAGISVCFGVINVDNCFN